MVLHADTYRIVLMDDMKNLPILLRKVKILDKNHANTFCALEAKKMQQITKQKLPRSLGSNTTPYPYLPEHVSQNPVYM